MIGSQKYLDRVWIASGIPEKFITLTPEQIEKDGRSKTLWDIAMQRAISWQEGRSTERGVLFSGNEGAGKSLALWCNARAAVKSWLSENYPDNEIGITIAPVYCKRFKNWLRFEFAPQRESKNWNFQLVHEMTSAQAIFLDDLTLDPNHEAYRPLREFIEILVDDLSVMLEPPPLYITTNNSANDWKSLLGHQLVDRIGGPKDGLCEIVKCEWESYR